MNLKGKALDNLDQLKRACAPHPWDLARELEKMPDQEALIFVKGVLAGMHRDMSAWHIRPNLEAILEALEND